MKQTRCSGEPGPGSCADEVPTLTSSHYCQLRTFTPLYWNFLRTGVGYGELRIPGKKVQTIPFPPTIFSIQLILQIWQMPNHETFYISQGSFTAFTTKFPKTNIFNKLKRNLKTKRWSILQLSYLLLWFLFLWQCGFSYRVVRAS